MTNFVFACKTTLQINFKACLVYRVRTASWACDLMLVVHTESFNMHAVTSLLHHVNTSSRANQPCAGDGIGDFSHTWLISLLRLPFFLNFFYFYRENSSCILQWLEVLGWKWQTIQIRGSRDGCFVTSGMSSHLAARSSSFFCHGVSFIDVSNFIEWILLAVFNFNLTKYKTT